jgi:hypothetical protein
MTHGASRPRLERGVRRRSQPHGMCAMSWGMLTQLCIRSSYTENAGAGNVGSANAPTGITAQLVEKDALSPQTLCLRAFLAPTG